LESQSSQPQSPLPSTPGGLLLGQPAYRALTPWGGGWAILAAGLITLAGILAATLFGFIELGRSGAQGAAVSRHGRDAMATLLVWQATTIVLTVSASTLFGGRIRDVLALRTPAAGATVYGSAILAMIAFQIVVSIVQFFFVSGDVFIDLRPFVELAIGPNWALALIVIGIGAPLSEELLFRGFLLSALAKTRAGFTGAALVTTSLWTALHVNYSLLGIVEVFSIGLFFCWMLWRTGSLTVPIFCHALYNALIVCLLRFVTLPGAPVG